MTNLVGISQTQTYLHLIKVVRSLFGEQRRPLKGNTTTLLSNTKRKNISSKKQNVNSRAGVISSNESRLLLMLPSTTSSSLACLIVFWYDKVVNRGFSEPHRNRIFMKRNFDQQTVKQGRTLWMKIHVAKSTTRFYVLTQKNFCIWQERINQYQIEWNSTVVHQGGDKKRP
ncbi:unnamed protein product [Amoebophrya sp. A120]|nr:unnamed protein product [Amoebophrya sp. A120]|eukprot:GSA120T00013916001.1